MKLRDAIENCIDNDDAKLAGDITDYLRFRKGWTYGKILSVVQEVRPEVEDAKWDEMLYEADMMADRAGAL